MHLGADYGGCPGQVVYSPIDGVVREASYREGYGGNVVIEGTIDGGPVTVVVGHLLCDIGCLDPNARPDCGTDRASGGITHCGALLVTRDQIVGQGTPLGVIGPRSTYQNGGYSPHVHIGIHRGEYTGAWELWGYAGGATGCDADDLREEYVDPTTAISCGGSDCPNAVGLVEGQENGVLTEAFRSAYARNVTDGEHPLGCSVNVGDVGIGQQGEAILAASGTRDAHQVDGVWIQDFCQPQVDDWFTSDGLSALLYNSTEDVRGAYLLFGG